MLTLVLYGVLAILLGGALFLLAAFLLPAGEQIAPAIRDEPPWELPATRRLGVADVAEVRLPVALRGYRFAETDLLLDRLADELRERDEEIARLRAGPAGGAAPLAPAEPAAPAWARWNPSTDTDTDTDTEADGLKPSPSPSASPTSGADPIDPTGYAPPDRPAPPTRGPAHAHPDDRADDPSPDEVPDPSSDERRDPDPSDPADRDA